MLNIKQYNEKIRLVYYFLSDNVCKDISRIIYEYLDITKESPYLRWYKNYIKSRLNREFMAVQELNNIYGYKTCVRDYKYLCKNNHLNWYIFDAFATKYKRCIEKISGKIQTKWKYSIQSLYFP